jgi:hypothetical protein
MLAREDPDLDRQGWLLLAFDLLVVAIVIWVLGVMLASDLAGYAAIVLAAGGVLAVMAAFVAGARSATGPFGTSGARTAPG